MTLQGAFCDNYNNASRGRGYGFVGFIALQSLYMCHIIHTSCCKVQSTYGHSQRHMAVDSLNYPLITEYDVVGNLTTLSLI